MTLEQLLDQFEKADGLGRIVQMAILRQYCREVDMSYLLEEIKKIDNDKWLDVLIGVGMRGALYYAVIARKAELLGIF